MWQSEYAGIKVCLGYFSEDYFVFQVVMKNLKLKTDRNIILLVLYACETWSLTLREELGLMVFENRVLRDIWA